MAKIRWQNLLSASGFLSTDVLKIKLIVKITNKYRLVRVRIV